MTPRHRSPMKYMVNEMISLIFFSENFEMNCLDRSILNTEKTGKKFAIFN